MPPAMRERLTRKRTQRGGDARVFDLGPSRLSIHRIADNRPAARGQVDANLMRASGRQTAAEERQAGTRGGDAREPLETG